MSQILTLELNDQVFAAIKQQAENIGIPPENLAATLLEEKIVPIFRLLLTDTEKENRRSRFESHFGSLKLDCPTDLNNEIIDADLAQEYSNLHEQE